MRMKKNEIAAPRSLQESLPRDSANHGCGAHLKHVRPRTYQATICRYLLLPSTDLSLSAPSCQQAETVVSAWCLLLRDNLNQFKSGCRMATVSWLPVSQWLWAPAGTVLHHILSAQRSPLQAGKQHTSAVRNRTACMELICDYTIVIIINHT